MSNNQSAAGNIGRNSNDKVLNGALQRDAMTLADLDVRTERCSHKIVKHAFLSDDDSDFVTPREFFGDNTSSAGTSCTNKKKSLKLSKEKNFNENECTTVVEVGGNALDVTNIRLHNNEYGGKDQRRLKHQTEQPVKKRQKLSEDKKTKIGSPANEFVGKSIQKKGKKRVARGKKSRTPTSNTKRKTGRIYHRYIQKKFSPSIMSDVILNLSESQKKWVSTTGFEALLDFRMMRYTHNLGYNVVESFNGADCSLVLKAGNIYITESIVHSVMGFPNGTEIIKFCKDRAAYSHWGEQFPACKIFEITPSRVRNKILESPEADENFKWNFMIMMYNFFIESNQNGFLTRDVLRFTGDVENCGKYNWCRLMIEKLKETHSYWAKDTKRNFAGPLPFLIYLYVSKVQKKGTTFIRTNYPTYRGWSDMLLRERQQFDTKEKCFGKGEIVKFSDVTVNGVLEIRGDDEACPNGTELPICHIVDGTDMQNKDENNEMIVCKEFTEIVEAKKLNDNKSSEVLTHDIVLHGYVNILNVATKRDVSADPITMDFTYDINDRAEKEFTSYKNEATTNEKNEVHNLHYITQEKRNVCEENPAQMEMVVKAGLEINTENLQCVDSIEEKVSGFGTDGVTTTQKGVDDEIEHHFMEDTYVQSFETNLNELKVMYDKCVDNFEVAFSLFPKNVRLVDLKEKYSFFFKMFAETSPISKSLSVGNVRQRLEEANEEDLLIPKFSLDLSQMTPKNLHTAMHQSADSPFQGICGGSFITAQGEIAVKEGCNDIIGQHSGGPNKNKVGGKPRPRREINPSHFLKSPFVSRVVDVNVHQITIEERNVWEWLFNTRENINDILFKWNDRMCTSGHFQSMRENNMIESTVIDTWSYLLNENEILRDNASPLRLFMTTETTYGPLRMEVGEGFAHDKLERNALFDDNMDLVVQMVSHMHKKQYEVKDFDMFVFPIYSSGHHYIICYNMKKPALQIIDNMFLNGEVEERYGDLPARLHECFCEWISIYNLPKEREIMNLVPKVVRMGWQTVENSVDCGIFVMRHMETYMGNLFRWKVGLRIEKDNQKPLLNKLRIIYCHRILTWMENCNRNRILKSAAMFGKAKNLIG